MHPLFSIYYFFKPAFMKFLCPFFDLSDDNEIPMPAHANCKIRGGCRVAATYKNSISIAWAQHAAHDMKPFNRASRK